MIGICENCKEEKELKEITGVLVINMVDHSNTICHKCGSRETRTHASRGKPDWRKYKDEKGFWNGKSYICYYCYFDIGKSRNRVDHSNTICCICGSNKTSGSWLRYRDKNGNWDYKSYQCTKCYSEILNKLPDSYQNFNKLLRKCRSGTFSIKDNMGKGYIGEFVLAKVRGLENINVATDNYHSKFDLRDMEYGLVQSKFRVLNSGKWVVRLGMDHNFDTIIALCLSEDMTMVERVYLIPEGETYGLTNLTFYKDTPRRLSKWEKFRIDERPYDDTYKSIMYYLKDRHRFSISDLIQWLNMK